MIMDQGHRICNINICWWDGEQIKAYWCKGGLFVNQRDKVKEFNEFRNYYRHKAGTVNKGFVVFSNSNHKDLEVSFNNYGKLFSCIYNTSCETYNYINETINVTINNKSKEESHKLLSSLWENGEIPSNFTEDHSNYSTVMANLMFSGEIDEADFNLMTK